MARAEFTAVRRVPDRRLLGRKRVIFHICAGWKRTAGAAVAAGLRIFFLALAASIPLKTRPYWRMMFSRLWRLAKAIGQIFLKSGHVEPDTAPDSGALFSAEMPRTPDPHFPHPRAEQDQPEVPFTAFLGPSRFFKASAGGFTAFTDRRDSKDDEDPFDYGRERPPPGGYSPSEQRRIDIAKALQQERWRRI